MSLRTWLSLRTWIKPKNELFFLHKDPREHTKRMLIYDTMKHLDALMNWKIGLSGVTFSRCPKIFSKIWKIHGEVKERAISPLYFLMSKADKSSYVRSLEVIKKYILKSIEENQGEKAVGVGRLTTVSTQISRMRNSHVAVLDFNPPKSKRFLQYLDVNFKAATSTSGRYAFTTWRRRPIPINLSRRTPSFFLRPKWASSQKWPSSKRKILRRSLGSLKIMSTLYPTWK